MKTWKISPVLRIVLIYALMGGAWILLSDKVAGILFTNPIQLSLVQTYKGWLYVVLTAVLLFFLIKNNIVSQKTAEQNFSDLFESTTEGIFHSTPGGYFINVNTAMADMYGYNSPQEMIKTINDVSTQTHLSPDSHAHFSELLIKNEIVDKFVARNLRKDGSIIWTSINARAVKNKNGNILYFEGFVTDITKQKSAESALFDNEERYRMLVEKLPAVVFMDKFNESQSTQYISPRLKDLLGYSPEEWESGDNLWENSLHPDDKERVVAEDIRTDKTGDPFRIEYRIRHREGHYVWVKEDASIILGESGTPLFWHGILLDITDQKHIEETLQRRDAIIKAVGFSAERFLKSSNWKEDINQVLARLGQTTQVSRVYVFKKETSHEGSVLISQAFEWCNDGIKPQINNETLQNMDLAAAGFERWIEIFNKGLPIYGIIKNFPIKEQKLLDEQGILALICIPLQIEKSWWGFIGFDECIVEREWTETEIEALKAASNTLSAAIERKISEETLLNSETSYRGLFDSIHDAIYVQDINGVFLDINDGAVNMYGYPKEYVIGKTLEILSAPDKNDMNKIAGALKDAFNGEIQQFEFWGKRSNGEIFPKDVRVFKGAYFGQEVLIAVSQDITARKRDEDDLQKQLKELTVLHSVALAESIAKNIDELIQRVTDIIGDALYPDNCGVLLLNETRDKLKPHSSYRGTSRENLAFSAPLTQGLTGKVAATGKLIRSGDVLLEPAYYETTDGIRSELCIPLNSKTKIIGVLNVESKQLHAFTRNDERLLNTIAGGMANAIERIQLFELERMRRKQAEILREATGTLTSFSKLETLFENIFNSLDKLISYDSASIEMINQGYLEIVAGRNIPEELIGKKYISDPEKWGDTYNLRQPVIIPDAQQDVRFEKFKETSYIHGWMEIPLFVADKIIGFLNLDSRTPGFFNQEHAAVAQTFANQAAIALENARLFQEESHRSRIIEALANIANEIAITSEVIPALDKIAERALSLLNANTIAVYLLQDDHKTIKIVTVHGDYQKEMLSHTIKVGEGITGNIIATGKPEIVDNIAKDPRKKTVPGTSEEDTRLDTVMSAPLTLHGESIGAINAWRLKSKGLFDKSELNFLVSIAHQASISIESMRLFEETTRRAQEAAAIAEVGRDISATLQLDNVLERIAIYAKDLLRSETSAVYLTEPGTPLLRAISAIGVDSNEIKNDPLQLGVGILGDIAMRKSGEIVNNTTADLRTIPVKGTEILPDEHIMGVPVLSKNQLTGLLVVWRTGMDKEFKATDLDFLRSLAQQAAVAIENARLFEAEHKRRQEAEILSQATSALANTLDINSLFENILDWLKKIAPYDSASIMLTDGDIVKLAAKRNLPEHFRIEQNFPMTEKWKAVSASRKPLILEDAQENKKFENWEGSSYIHGWMCIAMFTQDKLIGFINLDSKTVGAYTEEHGILIQTFANQAATAIENVRLFELEQKRRENAETVRQATTTLSNLLDLPSLHKAILEWLHKITPYDSASILEIEGDQIRITAARGLPTPEKALDQFFPSDNILCKIMNETNEPLIIEDCNDDPRFERWGGINNVRGWMGVPMISRGQVIGYITLDSHTPNAFTQNDAVAAQTFAHQAATSLENSRLFTETRQRLDELEIVSRVSFSLRAARDTKEMLPILLNEIKASVETDSAAIWLYDFENNELKSKVAAGWFNNLPKSNFKPNEGIVGMVYSSGVAHATTSVVNDSIANLENAKFFGENASGIAVPIRTATETIGALAVALNAPHKVKSHQTRLVTTLAEIAGNAIYRSNLYERSEEQIQRLTTLRELDTAIASSLDLHITLGIMTESLISKMGVDAATVLVFNPDSQLLEHYAATGFKNRNILRTPISIGNSLASQILLSRKAMYIKNIKKETNLYPTWPLTVEKFTSYYAVPLFSKGATRGILETYFRTPFSPTADWIDFLHTLAGQATIAIDNAQLFENLQQSNQELSLAYDTTLEGWGKALELRDKDTQGHTRRVTNLTLELARQIGIPESELLHIRRGALLHDIGKMGVPDNILRKKGPLTQVEILEMHKHPQYAYDLLAPITYLRPTVEIAYCHHEWWDGSGYPRGLKGEEIPLSARIFAVADVWDALSSDRPYRKAWPRKKILEYIKSLSGKQFDPHVLSVFYELIENEIKITNSNSHPAVRSKPIKNKEEKKNTKKKR